MTICWEKSIFRSHFLILRSQLVALSKVHAAHYASILPYFPRQLFRTETYVSYRSLLSERPDHRTGLPSHTVVRLSKMAVIIMFIRSQALQYGRAGIASQLKWLRHSMRCFELRRRLNINDCILWSRAAWRRVEGPRDRFFFRSAVSSGSYSIPGIHLTLSGAFPRPRLRLRVSSNPSLLSLEAYINRNLQTRPTNTGTGILIRISIYAQSL